MSFATMLRGLTRKKVKFVVIGGVAAAAHGSSRVTNDLDICYDAADAAHARILADLLAGWRAYPRGVEEGLPFIMDERTLRGAPVMTLSWIGSLAWATTMPFANTLKRSPRSASASGYWTFRLSSRPSEPRAGRAISTIFPSSKLCWSCDAREGEKKRTEDYRPGAVGGPA